MIPIPGRIPGALLPGDDLVEKLLLLSGGADQIDPGSLNALMAHKVGQKGNIIEPREKVFGKEMAERVGIYGIRVDAVFSRVVLQLGVDSPSGDLLSPSVQEKKPAGLAFFLTPHKRLLTEGVREINAPQLAALGVQIQITAVQVFYLNLDKLTDPGPCGSQKPHHKIPQIIFLLF